MRPDLANYEAVVFDLFHTLISLEHTAVQRQQAREYLGIPREVWNQALFSDAEDRLRGNVSSPVAIIRNIVDKVKPNIGDEQIVYASRLRLRQFQHSLSNVLPHVLSTIKQLKQRGKRLGLISNADKIEAFSWADTEISTCFDSVIFSCDVGHIKPEAPIYQLGLDQMKIPPHRCLFVGDGGNDELAGAKRAGMDAAITLEFLPDPNSDSVRRRRTQADYEIRGIEDLL